MRPFIIIALASLAFFSCKHDNTESIIPEGEIGISQLKDKANYTFPITIYKDVNGKVLINDTTVLFNNGSYELPFSGFYKISFEGVYGSQIVSINLFDPERGDPEWGLKKWIPALPQLSDISNEEIDARYPSNAPDNIKVPYVFYIQENHTLKKMNSQGNSPSHSVNFLIKNGVGSVNLDNKSTANASFTIGGKQVNSTTNKINSVYLELSGTISQQIIIPQDSLVKINGDIEITKDGSLTIKAGAVIIVTPEVNIKNYGPVRFLGTMEKPILVTCSESEYYWGGFISEGQNGAFEANHTFFCYSGFNEGGNFSLGHAKRQALFQTTNSSLTLSNCYMLDNIGQIFYPENSNLDLDSLLIQRAKTGGQLNRSTVTIDNCIFTDFPNDNQSYRNDDNDALYISVSDVTVKQSIFMYAKDDGVDSGGNEGGTVTFNDCAFESCFHEGAALSTQEPYVRVHSFTNCEFRNNGQGLELGYSSSMHNVYVESCFFENNHIGIRYGDNYGWAQAGYMHVSNSVSINNDRDVWNMLRSSWEPLLDHMKFENTFVSKKSTQYPNLEIYSL